MRNTYKEKQWYTCSMPHLHGIIQILSNVGTSMTIITARKISIHFHYNDDCTSVQYAQYCLLKLEQLLSVF